MSVGSTYLYFDKDSHTWKFNISQENELKYSIMYDEDKWTKEIIIDDKVLDFIIKIDRQDGTYQEKACIVYTTEQGELKCSTWENNQWLTKILYRLESTDYELTEINAHIIEENIHVFFIVKNNNQNKQGTLMHFCWNKEKSFFNKISNIALINDVYMHYEIEASEDGTMYLLFINNEVNETALKFTEYKNDKWINLRRLYGINGNNISFCTMLSKNKINILNFSKEDFMFTLEHVLVEPDGSMMSNKIYESPISIDEYMLIEKDNLLYVLWCENEKILYSYYKEVWSIPKEYRYELNGEITIYRYLSSSNKYKNIKAKKILGTIPPEITLIIPQENNNGLSLIKELVKEDNISKMIDKGTTVNNYSDTKNIANGNEIKDSLEKKILAQQLQLQQKQKIVEDMERNLTKLISDKRIAEEKIKIITDIQQTNLKELEEIKRKANHYEKENLEIKYKMQNILLQKEQAEKLLEDFKIENSSLKEQLLCEKNRGIIDIIFNKRNGI